MGNGLRHRGVCVALHVLSGSVVEQAELLDIEALRLHGELHALEQCVLVGELVDQRLLVLDLCG